MTAMVSYDVCGNDRAPADTSCPFSGARRAGNPGVGGRSLDRVMKQYVRKANPGISIGIV